MMIRVLRPVDELPTALAACHAERSPVAILVERRAYACLFPPALSYREAIQR
jgi:hypothetical protein